MQVGSVLCVAKRKIESNLISENRRNRLQAFAVYGTLNNTRSQLASSHFIYIFIARKSHLMRGVLNSGVNFFS